MHHIEYLIEKGLLTLFRIPVLFLVFISFTATAQYSDVYKPSVTRLLFLLDGSGSMNEKWDGKSKFNISKKLLINMIDSLEKANPDIEFGVRIFGHQSPKPVKNCKDSRLEVQFAKKNMGVIANTLNRITPKGWTPIAYSLFLAAEDFPKDPTSKNAIVLITDGLETCDGDLCASGRLLQNQRITLRPFIIGLGLGEEIEDYFNCVGTYFDASSSATFEKTLNTVISQALNTTTAQINLLNEFGIPNETNIEISLYDSYTDNLLYNFVHALDKDGNPDKITLDPVGRYDMKVHSTPPVYKDDIELTPGKLNIIPINLPRGSLELKIENQLGSSTIQGIIKRSQDEEFIALQGFNTTHKYLTGVYHVEVLTLPRRSFSNVEIWQSQTTEILIPKSGTLLINSTKKGIASLYVETENGLERVYEFKELTPRQSLRLLPGKYILISRFDNYKSANFTREEKFEIISNATTSIRF